MSEAVEAAPKKRRRRKGPPSLPSIDPANPYRVPGPALISFSGGRTSAYMLWHIIQAHGGQLPDDVVVCFSNTGREMPETLDFVQECAARWGVRIHWLEYDEDSEFKTKVVSHNSASRNGEPLIQIFKARMMLSNPVMRFCTIEGKIKRMQAYMRWILGHKSYYNCVGLRADEPSRVEKQKARAESGKDGRAIAIPVMPLADAGVARRDVAEWWSKQPFDLRLPGNNGKTPLGNCDLCYLKSQATLQGIMRQRPELADWWIEREAQALKQGKTKSPRVCLFRADRPNYAEMLRLSQLPDLFDPPEEDDGESLDCTCTE